MPPNDQATINVNNVSVNTQVSDNDQNNKNKSEKTLQEQISGLSERLNSISDTVEQYTCCQAPFDEALGRYLAHKFEQNSLSKRI